MTSGFERNHGEATRPDAPVTAYRSADWLRVYVRDGMGKRYALLDGETGLPVDFRREPGAIERAAIVCTKLHAMRP